MNSFFPRTYWSVVDARRKMGTQQKRKTLSLDTKYELVMAINKKEKPKSEIAKNFGINPSTRWWFISSVKQWLKHSKNFANLQEIELFIDNECNKKKQTKLTDFFN